MPSNNRNAQTPDRLKIKQKEQRAVELRLAGVKHSEIARQLGWADGSAAHKAIKRAMREAVQEPVAELRQMEVERLDAMLTALWPAALKGKWLAHDRILKIMERKAALLGLDAPQRRIVEVITDDKLREAVEDLAKRNAELEQAQPQLGSAEVDYTVPAEDIQDAEDVEAELVEADVVDPALLAAVEPDPEEVSA